MSRSSLPAPVRRADAVDKVRRKYLGRTFEWGITDCVTLSRSLLVALGKRPPKLPRYRNALGARRALKEQGFDSLEALLDALLPRISPASMKIGDIAAMEGTDSFAALAICAGRKLIGFQEEHPGLVPMENCVLTGAWSVT